MTLRKASESSLTTRLGFSTSLSSLQFTEEEAACSRDAEEDVMAPPPLQMSVEELAFSEFISV